MPISLSRQLFEGYCDFQSCCYNWSTIIVVAGFVLKHLECKFTTTINCTYQLSVFLYQDGSTIIAVYNV